MFKYILPSYTAERYYLLSEIEQRGKFVYTSEASDGERADIKTLNDEQQLAIYILWDTRDGIEKLSSQVSEIDEFLRYSPNRRFVLLK